SSAATNSHSIEVVGSAALLLMAAPFINQMTRSPVPLFCQTISDCPSALKSTPTTSGPALACRSDERRLRCDGRSLSHSKHSPVVRSRQSRSDFLSLLKSPTPHIFQVVDTVPRLMVWVNVVPFINQMTRSPVLPFCQTISDCPSALKSTRTTRGPELAC